MKKNKTEKRCSFCGKKMDINLDTCPHCNRKYTSFKKMFLFVTLGMLILVLGATIIATSIIGNNKTYTIVNNEKISKDYYSLNETVFCDNDELTVTNIQEKTNKDDAGISKNSKLIAVTYKIKNNATNEKTYYSWYFEVVNKNGEVINSKPAVITDMWNNEFLNAPTLSSKGEKEGYLVYEIDKDDNDYYIQYQCKSTLNKVFIKIKP